MQNYTRYVQTTGQNARKKNRRRKYGAAELIIPSKSCHIRSWLGGIHSYAYACMVTCNASKVDPNPAMHATCLCMFLVISLRKCCWQSQTRKDRSIDTRGCLVTLWLWLLDLVYKPKKHLNRCFWLLVFNLYFIMV